MTGVTAGRDCRPMEDLAGPTCVLEKQAIGCVRGRSESKRKSKSKSKRKIKDVRGYISLGRYGNRVGPVNSLSRSEM